MWKILFAPLLAVLAFLHGPSYPKVVDKAASSVVRITGIVVDDDDDRAQYVCTGFSIGLNRVLTAAHCMGVDMLADGTPVDSILKVDKYLDLALLSVKTSKPPLTFRESPVERYETVTPIGYAFGLNRLYATPHHVILIDIAPIPEMRPGIMMEPVCIGGQSGGPIVDANDEVVAVTQQTAAGTCFGVGSLLIRGFLLGT